MVVERQVTSYVKTAIEVTDISILSVEEYRVAEDNIPPLNEYWWLRSPGNYGSVAACVCPDGNVGVFGSRIIDDSVGVRPTLRIHPKSVNLQIGDKVRFYGRIWTYIAKGILLCDEIICRMPFRGDGQADDANDYEKSDIKAYLDTWFRDYVKREDSEPRKVREPLFCIIGRTGSGKSTVARIFEEEFGKKQVRSYTTRPMRPGEKKSSDHIFITPEEVRDYISDAAAYTKIGAYEYFTTYAVLDKSDTYVIDPIGVANLRTRVKDRPIYEIYVTAGNATLTKRLVDRQDGTSVVEKRREAEKAQFDAYELLKPWDYLIENDGTIEDLRKKVSDIVKAAGYTGSTADRYTGPKPNGDPHTTT